MEIYLFKLLNYIKSFLKLIYFLVQILFLGVLASAILNFFVVGQPWWPTFLLNSLPPPTIIKLPTVLQMNYKS